MSYITKIIIFISFLSVAQAQNKNINIQDLDKKDLMSAYNSPSRIDVKSSWDVFISGSYILWQAKERGLDLAHSYPQNTTSKSFPVKMDFDYKSGFKVGVCTNFDHDDWNLFFQYVRLHLENKKSENAQENGYLLPTKVFYSDVENTNNHASNLNGKWYLDYDMIDIELGRPCYVGSNLTFKPHFGVRWGWIKQKDKTSYTFTNLEEPFNDVEASSKARSDSWLLGPRAGLYTNWLLGDFRILANAAASAVYQNFKTYFKQDDFENINNLDKNVKSKIGYVLANCDIILGLGWGTYFDDKNWHFDVLAGYEFLYFWDQNMMRVLIDRVLKNVKTKADDLVLHGLTVTARFDF